MELALCEIQDCLEALSGYVTAKIMGCLSLEIVERVIEERDKLLHCLELLSDDQGMHLRKTDSE